jgi:hypothetical protein
MQGANIDSSWPARADLRFFQLDDDEPAASARDEAPESAERILGDWLVRNELTDTRPVLKAFRAAARRDFRGAFAAVAAAAPILISRAAMLDEAERRLAGPLLGGMGLLVADQAALDELLNPDSLRLRGAAGPVLCRMKPRTVLVCGLSRTNARAVCGVWDLGDRDDVIEFLLSRHGIGIGAAQVRFANAEPVSFRPSSEHARSQLAGAVAAVATLATASILGTLDRCLDDSFAYAGRRTAFGKTIIQHQAVALRLADLVIGRDTLCLMMWQHADRHARGAQSLAETDMLVAHAAAVAHQVTRDALQVFAAHGYVGGKPVAAAFREAKAASIFLPALTGTPEA